MAKNIVPCAWAMIFCVDLSFLLYPYLKFAFVINICIPVHVYENYGSTQEMIDGQWFVAFMMAGTNSSNVTQYRAELWRLIAWKEYMNCF